MIFVAIIYVLAFLVSLYFIIPIVNVILNYCILRNFCSRIDEMKKAGEWAIVTGSTDGIGKAFAHELAKMNLKILLISRNLSKLNDVANEIKEKHGVETKVLVADFSNTDIYDEIKREVDSLPSIACLVNNVGVSYRFDSYANGQVLSIDFIQKLIACNVNSMACMSKIVLPKLMSQPSCGSAIINVASFSGLVAAPFLSLYAGTKAFALHFTRSLSLEPTGGKVIFQTLSPFFVATNMTKMKSNNLFVPSPSAYASSALSMLGVTRDSTGYLPHEFLKIISVSLPDAVMAYFTSKMVRKPKAT